MLKSLVAAFAAAALSIIMVAVINCLISSSMQHDFNPADSGTMQISHLSFRFFNDRTVPEAKRPTAARATETTSYFEYSGVIHVHTTYSDGGGGYEEIVGIADSLGIDFIVPSDHNTLEPISDGWARYEGNVLVIPAVENSMDQGAGHYLAIGDSLTLVRSHTITSDSVYRETVANGNMIFLAHVFHPVHNSWGNWDIDDFTGIEIFNLDENWRSNLHPFRFGRLIAAALVYPHSDRSLSYLITTPEKQLEKFDDLNMTRKVVAIGSTDAHGRRLIPDEDGTEMPNYASTFKTVQTVIVTREPFNGDYDHDRHIVMTSLRDGHSYVGFPCFGDVTGFLFTAVSDGFEATCGDSLILQGETRFHVVLPDSQNVTLQVVRNGVTIREAANVATLDWTSDEPGVYRIQVFQDRVQLPFLQKRHYPWILSNPIYLSDADELVTDNSTY